MSAPWFKPTSLLDKTYTLGILIKGIDGVLELLGGVLILTVPPSWIMDATDFLSLSEFGVSQHNFLSQSVVKFGHDLAYGSHVFAAIFLLTHGLVKVVLVASLLRNYRRAYPFALVTLSLFLVYQFYAIITHFTWGMTFLTVIDIVIIWLIWREWGQQKQRWANQAPAG